MIWLLALLFVPFVFNTAFGQQEVNITESTPCFLNQNNSGIEYWQDCGIDTDYLAGVTVSFEWVTGGLFSMIIVGLLIFMTWVKYHTPFYPIMIGLVFLPLAGYLFPDIFISAVAILLIVAIAGIIWYIMVKRTQA
jgi:hypothetical protein